MFSKFLRQTHMYLALFLAPWILLYTLSTIAMTHREAFSVNSQTRLPWEKESEQYLPVQFSANATPEFMGQQVLQILQLGGLPGHAQQGQEYADGRAQQGHLAAAYHVFHC